MYSLMKLRYYLKDKIVLKCHSNIFSFRYVLPGDIYHRVYFDRRHIVTSIGNRYLAE